MPDIVRLTAGDTALLRAMLDMFGRVFEEPATYGGAQPDDAYLRRLLGGELSSPSPRATGKR